MSKKKANKILILLVIIPILLYLASTSTVNAREDNYTNVWVWLPIINDEGNEVGYWQYLDGEGNPIPKFYNENGKTWYSVPNIGYYKGWLNINSSTYYLNKSSGIMLKGWQYIDGYWRYFRNSGTMIKNRWDYVECFDGSKAWKYFNENGIPQQKVYSNDYGTYLSYNAPNYGYKTGWQYIENAWRFFRISGTMVTNRWEFIKTFDESKSWKFFNSNGVSTQKIYSNNTGFYLSTAGPERGYFKGWWTDLNTGNKYYYRLNSGSRVEGWQYIENAWRYFKPKTGEQLFGFQKINTSYYYLRENSGSKATGWQYIDETWRYFRDSGTMVSGSQYIDGKWYKFGHTGISYDRTNNVSSLTGIVLSSEPEVNKVVKLKGNIDSASINAYAIDAVKKVRSDMYDKNVPFNGKTLRQVVSELGYTSKAAYINDVRWNTTAERVAIQRAAETAYHNKFGHIRANGENIFTAKDIEGLTSFYYFCSENLAWYPSFSSAFEAWTYGELEDLLAANGVANGENGHLHNIINPSSRFFGFAEIISDENRYGRVQAMASFNLKESSTVEGEKPYGLKGTYYFDVSIDK